MFEITGHIKFPQFSAIRCLMMPYIQGEPDSLPELYAPYRDIVSSLFYEKGDIGFLTIDESPVVAGNPPPWRPRKVRSSPTHRSGSGS